MNAFFSALTFPQLVFLIVVSCIAVYFLAGLAGTEE
jgi:hypothetical protein